MARGVRANRSLGAAMTRKPTRQAVDERAAQPQEVEGRSASSARMNAAQSDRLLVERCLLGEVAAWEELYSQHHSALCFSIRSSLTPACRDANLVDEIVARVWYALVRNDGELLDRFDPQWGLRLATFLRGLARLEIMQYFRAEQRRRKREAKAGRRPPSVNTLPDCQIAAMLDEFTATLTEGEQRFLEEYLLLSPQEATNTEGAELSDANIWQRRHRIRSRLLAFFRDEE
jgi:hypothetical protein